MKAGDFLDIDRVAFIGRTYFEYMRMFDLDESVLRKGPVLDCAAGPSSFTAEARGLGFNVVACDLLYGSAPGTLLKKGKEDIEHVFEKVEGVPHLYVWEYYKNRNEIIALRHKALELFIGDFTVNRDERYVHAELPRLPFPGQGVSSRAIESFSFSLRRPAGPGFSQNLPQGDGKGIIRGSEDLPFAGFGCTALSSSGGIDSFS